LAGPLVEPLKLATVFIAGEGHWVTSGLVMLFALCGQSVLSPTGCSLSLTLPWFAACMGEVCRGSRERGAPSRTAPARWLDGASFCAKSGQIFFGRHVFDTVLGKIL
jgi:hypothetical protein